MNTNNIQENELSVDFIKSDKEYDHVYNIDNSSMYDVPIIHHELKPLSKEKLDKIIGKSRIPHFSNTMVKTNQCVYNISEMITENFCLLKDRKKEED